MSKISSKKAPVRRRSTARRSQAAVKKSSPAKSTPRTLQTGTSDKVKLSGEAKAAKKGDDSRVAAITKALSKDLGGSPKVEKGELGKLNPAEKKEWTERLGDAELVKGLKRVDSVGHLQSLLNEREAAGLKVDKAFGPKTEAAVKDAQRRLGLEPSGKFDAATRERLLSAGKKPQDTAAKEKGPASGTEEAKRRIQEHLHREHSRFGGQTIVESVGKHGTRQKVVKAGVKEHQKGVYKRVGDYWSSVGQRLNGRHRKQPWSAAFISHVHKKAGVGGQFKASIRHSDYIRDSIKAKKAGNTKAAYWGHRSSERAPKVGDLVAYARQRGISYDRQPRAYKSHTDIVTKVGKGYVEVIGGNVKDSVSKRRIPTDQRGLLLDQSKYFAVMEPRNLGR